MNTYVYVGGNPLNNIDPLGLFDGSSRTCYAVGMRIVCVSGQRPPPQNGTLLPDSTLSCETKCNVKFAAICTATTLGIGKVAGKAAGGICTVVKYKLCLKSCEEGEACPVN